MKNNYKFFLLIPALLCLIILMQKQNIKVAIIRERSLNPWEMQNYYGLSGVETIFIAPEDNTIPFSELPFTPIVMKKAHERKLSVMHWEKTLKNIIIHRAQKLWFYPYTLEQILKDVDIVHTVDLKSRATYTAAMLKKKYNFKLVVTVWENIPFLYRQKARWSYMRDHVLEYVDLIHAVTRDAQDALLVEGMKNIPIKIIPYGVDLVRFQPAKPVKRSYFTILFIGRHVYEKGIFELLNAIKFLTVTGVEDIRLVMVGNNTEGLKSTVKEMGIEKFIGFTGFVSYAGLNKIYNQADVFVLPSIPVEGWKEQYGMVLIEAMSSGLPIIASKSGSIPEVVGDTAVFVSPGEYKDIANAIRTLKNDQALRNRLAFNSRERAKELFDSVVSASRLSEMYRMLQSGS